jgi:hypothetical protein
MILDADYKKVTQPLSVGKYQFRMGIKGKDTWTKTTNYGNELYWLKMGITSNEELALIELHNSVTEFNKDGFQELFGDSRSTTSVLSLGSFTHNGVFSGYNLDVSQLSWCGEIDYDSSLPIQFDFYMTNISTGSITLDINGNEVIESYPIHNSLTKFTVENRLDNLITNLLQIKITISNSVTLHGLQVKVVNWGMGQHL